MQPVEIRKTILKMCAASGEGHIPSSFSVVEILVELYDHILKYRPQDPLWEGRDYFVLSKGHASAALYAVLAAAGFFPQSELAGFAGYHSRLGGHPDKNKVPGVEASTGSLGHGFPFAAGLALGLKIQDRPNRVFVLIGDGESNEGSIWETAMVAAYRRLDNLIGITDLNQSTGRCLPLIDAAQKWTAFGWRTLEVDGHDPSALHTAFLTVLAEKDSRPTMLIANTLKGKGSATLENDGYAWHHKSPSPSELDIIMKDLV